MSRFACYRMLRQTIVAIAGTLVTISALSTPAWAIDGAAAVALCIDSTASGAQCVWSANDKGEINVCNKSGCVYCPSANDECTAAKTRSRPARTLPVGTTVKTTLGSVVMSTEVSKDSFKGSLLSASCPDNLRRCKNRCIPSNEKCILEK